MTRKRMNEIHRWLSGMESLGIDEQTAWQLRRISMTLHRWHELECGDGNDYASWSIERDETSGKPYLVTHPHTGKSYRRAVPDRETGAKKRLAAIASRFPALWFYIQGDPRGCSLYVGSRADLREGDDISAVYTRGRPCDF